MKTQLILFGVIGMCLPLFAGEPSTTLSAGNSPLDTRWDTSLSHWDHVLSLPRPKSELQIGKSDFVVYGPLIEGFRYERNTDRSLGQKLVGLPIVRLFVPQRMSQPPGGTGRYFAWRTPSGRPWIKAATGAPVGGAFDGAYNEATVNLISIGF